MLEIKEIKSFINDDYSSIKKVRAKEGQAYYDADHDIKKYRIFYYNADGELVEDKTRSNFKIPHPFLTELNDQATQYILSGQDKFIISDLPELQKMLDVYFNENENFVSELSEVLTGCQNKGFEYMYAYKDENDRLAFECADSLGVVEVEARFASDKKDHIIYWYVDRVDKNGKKIKKIMDWDSENVYYYKQIEDGRIEPDICFKNSNVKPHILYAVDDTEEIEGDSLGFVPFWRMDNNKKQFSSLKPIKPLIDDYDLMASSLSNNLADFDTPIYAVKGFEGDDFSKLQQNLKTKKMVGVTEDGGLEVKTVDIPYEARVAKLELDEKNIYRFGMGLNTSGLKDTNATTNIAIKAMYALLDLKCSKLIIRLKQFLRKIIKVVLDEINNEQGTDYTMDQVKIEFNPEIMSNAQENAQIEQIEAQTKNMLINTLLAVATMLDNETLMKNICDVLDIDYEEIKSKLPDPDEADNEIVSAQGALDNVPVKESEIVNE